MFDRLRPRFLTPWFVALLVVWPVILAIALARDANPARLCHPVAILLEIGCVLAWVFPFVAYPHIASAHPFSSSRQYFVVDDDTEQVRLAPSGLYWRWRFSDRWYRGHGGRLIRLPIMVDVCPFPKHPGLVAYVTTSSEPTPEEAERTLFLYAMLDSLGNGPPERIRSFVEDFNAKGGYPKVALCQGRSSS